MKIKKESKISNFGVEYKSLNYPHMKNVFGIWLIKEPCKGKNAWNEDVYSYGKTKTLESYIHETIMKEQAKNRSTHSWLSFHSLHHFNPHNFLNVRASGRIEIRRKLSIDGASKDRNDGKYNKRVSKGGHDNNLKWSKWKLFWLEMMEKAVDELQIYREKATRMHGGNGQWGEKRGLKFQTLLLWRVYFSG